MSAVDELADLLMIYGVDLGDPVGRARKAQGLVSAGVDAETASAVFEHLEATAASERRAPGIIARAAMDPPSVLAMHRDLARYREARSDRAARRATKAPRHVSTPGVPAYPSPWLGCACAKCEEARAAGDEDHTSTNRWGAEQ